MLYQVHLDDLVAKDNFYCLYNKEQDQFECTRGNKGILPFRKIKWSNDKHGMRVYRSNNSKCKECPLRSTCIGRSDFLRRSNIV